MKDISVSVTVLCDHDIFMNNATNQNRQIILSVKCQLCKNLSTSCLFISVLKAVEFI